MGDLPADIRCPDTAPDGPTDSAADSTPAVDLDTYEARQRERTLTVATSITMVAAMVLAGLTVLWQDWFSTITLVALAALCAPVQWINRRSGHQVSGGILILLILAVVTINMIDGPGLHSLATLGYPVLIAIGGLTLGKRALWLLTPACFASLILVAALGRAGWVSDPGHPFDGTDLVAFFVLLGATAVVVWVSMDNTEKNIERIRRSAAKVRLAYERTLEAWARALEYRDRETEGHSRRVSELAVRLGRALGLDEGATTRLRWGALLHDIGKLAVPDAILLKPGPLTLDERRLMNRHPVYAREMLAGIPFLRSVVDIPYYHHERWDGSGYPEGLEAEEIPFTARIFAVVDQWEALSSDRPYRKAWKRDQIVKHLETEAGASLDPRIVQVFLDRLVAES